jgi:hypothetical protein
MDLILQAFPKVSVASPARNFPAPLLDHTRRINTRQASIPQSRVRFAFGYRRHRDLEKLFGLAPKRNYNEHHLHVEHVLGSCLGPGPRIQVMR